MSVLPVVVESLGVGTDVTGAGIGVGVTTSTFTFGAFTGVTIVSDRGFVQLARVEREARSTRGATICFFIEG